MNRHSSPGSVPRASLHRIVRLAFGPQLLWLSATAETLEVAAQPKRVMVWLGDEGPMVKPKLPMTGPKQDENVDILERTRGDWAWSNGTLTFSRSTLAMIRRGKPAGSWIVVVPA